MKPNCSLSDCPWRYADPDEHVPWCGGIPGHNHTNVATHQHRPKKGMGGRNSKSKVVALLCPSMHDMVDNGTKFKDEVFCYSAYGEIVDRHYRLWEAGHDYRLEEWALIWKEIPDGTNDGRRHNREEPPEAGVQDPVVRQETSGVELLPYVQDGHGDVLRDPRRPGTETALLPGHGGEPEELRLGGQDERVAIGHLADDADDWVPAAGVQGLTFQSWADKLLNMVHGYKQVAWKIGDHLVTGEDRFGDTIWQVVDQDLGIDHATVANWMSVCRAWPSHARMNASFTMHQLTAPLARQNLQEAQERVQSAVDGGMTTAELRAALKAAQGHEIEMCVCPTCGAVHKYRRKQ